jgi:hypothetical protein
MDILSAAGVIRRPVILAAVGLCAVACGGGGSGGSASTPAPPTSTAPASVTASATSAATESPPPGDIPDTTVYLAYRPASGQYEVKVPEGWARTVSSADVSFTDKLNTITIQTVRAAAAPTVASARTAEVPRIQGSVHGFSLTGISTVSRAAGTAVLIRYSADSQPDPVTGKVFRNAVERYEFYRNGTETVVTLAGPVGADNVDPWRTVTNSFRWLR